MENHMPSLAPVSSQNLSEMSSRFCRCSLGHEKKSLAPSAPGLCAVHSRGRPRPCRAQSIRRLRIRKLSVVDSGPPGNSIRNLGTPALKIESLPGSNPLGFRILSLWMDRTRRRNSHPDRGFGWSHEVVNTTLALSDLTERFAECLDLEPLVLVIISLPEYGGGANRAST